MCILLAISIFDSPVSGGVMAAETTTLTFMVCVADHNGLFFLWFMLDDIYLYVKYFIFVIFMSGGRFTIKHFYILGYISKGKYMNVKFTLLIIIYHSYTDWLKIYISYNHTNDGIALKDQNLSFLECNWFSCYFWGLFCCSLA